MTIYLTIGLVFCVAVLVFNVMFNGESVREIITIHWAKHCVILFLTMLLWPLCVTAFLYGLSQRTKVFTKN